MLLYRNFLIKLSTFSAIIFMLAACGFSPIHKQYKGSNSNTGKLSAIKIDKPKTLKQQLLTNKLEDLFNPKSLATDPKYQLSFKFKQNDLALIIERDRTITRYKIEIEVTYKLRDLESGKIVNKGLVKREGEYDKVESDYATYASKKGTIKRIVEELAEDTRIRITSFLSK